MSFDDQTVKVTFDPADGTAHADIRTPDHASYSTLTAFMQCPGMWAAGKVLPTLKPWGSPLVLGSIAHAALECAMREPERLNPDWLALCHEGIQLERRLNTARGWGDDPTPPVAMPDGRTATEDDWAKAAAAKLDGFTLDVALERTPTPAAMEQRLSATVWGIPMTGAVDYRDRSGEVVDWKTGKVPSNNAKRLAHADQLRVYKAMLAAPDIQESDGGTGWRKTGNVTVTHARDVYVEHRAWADADLSAPAMADTGTRLNRAWEGITSLTGDGSGAYPLRPSFLCGWCPMALHCPVAQLNAYTRRVAESNAYPVDDPRIRTHTPATTGRTSMDTDLMSLFGLADTTPATPTTPAPASKPAPAPIAPPDPLGNEPAPDPWATPAGQAALARWNSADTTSQTADTDKPSPASPVEQANDVWFGHTSTPAQPASPAKPAVAVESTPGMPAASTPEQPRVAAPVTVKPDPTSPPITLTAIEGKPYDPTLVGDRLNIAGYGFTQLTLTAGHAVRYADNREWAGAVADRMLAVEWHAARVAFGRIVPDVDGIMEGRPDRDQLLHWLDSTLARDVDRVLRVMLDDDPTVKTRTIDSKDAMVAAVDAAGRRLTAALTLVRRYLADDDPEF